MSPQRTVLDFLGNWKTIAGGVTLLLVFVGADGRATAQRLNTHLTQDVPVMLRAQEVRDNQQDDMLEILDALALAWCTQERNAIVRQRLECGDRERRAGIR